MWTESYPIYDATSNFNAKVSSVLLGKSLIWKDQAIYWTYKASLFGDIGIGRQASLDCTKSGRYSCAETWNPNHRQKHRSELVESGLVS